MQIQLCYAVNPLSYNKASCDGVGNDSYSEPYQTSKMECFAKIFLAAFSH